jgi:hypothetical protein
MAEHVVRTGDTLYGIARSHHIRYWPNLYFATENNEFRETHSNPDLIFPGDRVGIPTRESVAPMEAHPVKVWRDIPLFTQSAETCWRATGKMLYLRQNRASNEGMYNQRIGSHYERLETGLPSASWSDFYHARLGMTETVIASPNDLHRAIAQHGPVIVAVGDSTSAHSMVMAGYDLFQGRWFVLDPAAGEEMTFEAETVVVGGGSSSDSSSSGAARLTDFHTGPATWANMGRWLWILDTTVHERIFHY